MFELVVCPVESTTESLETPENVDDLIRLNDLNEGSLLWVLRRRYSEETPLIYVRVVVRALTSIDLHWTHGSLRKSISTSPNL
jgi:hypothetical protein